MSKMDDLARHFRHRYLAVSGGWFGSLVVSVAKPTGAWDPMVAAIIAVIFYQVVRTSKMEIAMLVGSTLDTVIPYQYWQTQGSYDLHKSHLDDYWPTFLIGTLIELGAYVLAEPSIFTLVVCIKSITLSFIWMGQTKEGVFLSSSIRHGKLAVPTTIPLGGIDWVVEGQDVIPICDDRHPTVFDDLNSKYSDSYTAWGMVNKLKSTDDDSAKKTLDRWMSEKVTKEKKNQYADKAKAAIRAKDPPSDSAPPPISPDPRHPNADRDLTPKYPDPWTRWGMIYSVKKQADDEKAKKMMESFLNGSATQDRKDKYAKIGRDKVRQRANAESTRSSPSAQPTNKPNATRVSMDLARAERLLTKAYPDDPIVREGMLETYRADQSDTHAEANLQSWTTDKSQKTEYLIKGQRARTWRNELRNQRVPVFVDDDSDKWNKLLKLVYPHPWIRYAIIARLWTGDPKHRESKIKDIIGDKTQVASRTKAYVEQGEALRDVFDDEGWEMKALHEATWKGEEMVTGADRGGTSIGKDRLAWLAKEMQSKRMGPSEVSKILEVFSRTRCESQEAAAMTRLRFHGIKNFELSDAEKAKNVKRFKPTINPNMAETLAAQLDDPELSIVSDINRQLAAELLRAPSHSREDMRKVANVLGEFGINPTAEAKATLDLDPKTLLDLRLKLIKLYDKGDLGTSLVDVMMSHVIRSPSIEVATKEANLLIEAGNQDQQRIVSDRFLANARRLEHMKAELSTVFKQKSIVEAMKVDILGKAPSDWDQEFGKLLAIGRGASSGTSAEAMYRKTLEEYKSRAVDDEYYRQYARNDLKKPGAINSLLSKVGMKRVYFGK